MRQQQLLNEQNRRLEMDITVNVVPHKLNRLGKGYLSVQQGEVDFNAVFIRESDGERQFVDFD